MSLSQNSYVFSNPLDKYLSDFLICFVVSKPSLAVMYSRLDLQFLHLPLCRPSARLSVRYYQIIKIVSIMAVTTNFFIFFLTP